MISALLIDDEAHCRETLSILLTRYCPDVQIVGQAASGAEGLRAITEHTPDVVFLDVEMPMMNGFEVLETLPAVNFEVIFTTGYDEYAIRAIRFSALDYLLKPIDKDDLRRAVAKIKPNIARQQPEQQMAQQLDILLQKLGQKQPLLQKIALPTLNGFELVPVESIVRCEADNNYARVWIKNAKPLLVSRTLKEMEELLAGHSFLRVHQSHVVNLNEIVRYVRGEGGYVVMSDGTSVNVSRTRKDDLLRQFGG